MMKLKTALNRCVKRRKNKVLASLIRHGLVAPALLTASLNAQALSSCETTIQLTLHDQTAMTPIISIITRHGEQVSTDSRHTYIAPLSCGTGYQITATLGNVTRSRVFSAGAVIIMDMGK